MKIFISFVFASLLTILMYATDTSGGKAPDLLFNLIGLLEMPGSLIMMIITFIFSPNNAWQAMHVSGPFQYLSYAANFGFYFTMPLIVFRYIERFRTKRNNNENFLK